MSQYNEVLNKKAVALRYDENKDAAPVIVASGLGYMAERIVEMANDSRGAVSGYCRYLCILSEIYAEAFQRRD